MLCWAANLVEAYNKEVRVGFKDRVMVLLRPSKGGGVEDVFKLTKGRSVNFFQVLHLCNRSTIFYENDDNTNRSHLGLPTSFPGSALGKAPKKTLLQVTSKAFNHKGNT